MSDKITLERIKQAHPKLRDEMFRDYTDANNRLGKGARLRFAYVYRSPQLQDELFNKKPKITNAKGWQSIHNYGLAFDIVLLYDNNGDGIFEEASYSQIRDFDKDAIADWKEITDFLKSRGWECGADWKKFKDPPHFQKTFGFDWKVLKQRIEKGITIIDNGIIFPKI
jgi:peptidoglycan L-alanyl-D-glutamate endopeptidase CwlK